jgi:hypothetical protein
MSSNKHAPLLMKYESQSLARPGPSHDGQLTPVNSMTMTLSDPRACKQLGTIRLTHVLHKRNKVLAEKLAEALVTKVKREAALHELESERYFEEEQQKELLLRRKTQNELEVKFYEVAMDRVQSFSVTIGRRRDEILGQQGRILLFLKAQVDAGEIDQRSHDYQIGKLTRQFEQDLVAFEATSAKLLNRLNTRLSDELGDDVE